MSKIPEDLKKLLHDGTGEMLKDTPVLDVYKLANSSDTPTNAAAVSYATVLGFSGDKMKGSMVVTCDRELLDKSHPNHAMEMPVNDADLGDWAGEIVNQMLGRVKNKVASTGIAFTMSTPTTVTGKSMQISAPKDGFVHQMVYQGPHGTITVNFLSVVTPGTTFESKGSAKTATEGDSILF